jgi:4-hydroxybenzoate polyprenyltransferase
VHPFPSLLNGTLVVGLVTLAGGRPAVALALGLGMLGLQFAIGAANDWFDADLDASAKPTKPIPAGLVARPMALAVAVASGGGGLAISALAAGPWAGATAALAALMLACGLAYDAGLKRLGWGWLAFALAFPLLPVYAWFGSTGLLPPGAELLLPLAFLAGPTLHLANSLVDLELDGVAGLASLAVKLGRRNGGLALVGLQAVIYSVAAASLFADPASPTAARALVTAAAGLTAVGVLLSGQQPTATREWGWRAQAIALALLALGWLLWRGAVAPSG